MSLRKCRNPLCSEMLDSLDDRFYHSVACRQQAYRNRVKIKRQLPIGQRTVIKYCLNCGEPFCVDARDKVQKFHSESCRVSHWQQMKRLDKKESEK